MKDGQTDGGIHNIPIAKAWLCMFFLKIGFDCQIDLLHLLKKADVIGMAFGNTVDSRYLDLAYLE